MTTPIRACAAVSLGVTIIAAGHAPSSHLVAALQESAVQQSAPARTDGTPAEYAEVLNKYCLGCHNAKGRAGGLTLDPSTLSNVAEHGAIWEKVAHKLTLREMPPSGMPRPDEAVYERFASWLNGSLDAAAKASPNPGRPALHRLNRTEYANAIRDLLGVEIDATELLPADDSTHGFDNNADVLGVSPELLESYVVAARKISRLAFGDPTLAPVSHTFSSSPDTNQGDHLEGLPFGTRGGLAVRHLFPLDGEYEFKIRLIRSIQGQIRGLNEPQKVAIGLDGSTVHVFTMEGGRYMYAEAYYDAATPSLNADDALRVRVPIRAGTHTVSATFPLLTSLVSEDMNRPRVFGPDDGNQTGGYSSIEGLTVTGPFSSGRARPASAPGRRILTCTPARPADELPCARKILAAFARRAYRGNVTEADVQRALAFHQQGRKEGSSFDAGIERAIWPILAAPQFIFRFETDPKNAAPGAAYAISDLELASRLSFFLWSSVPDDELLDLATRGKLGAPGALERQVRRMLADPRSQAMINNFARQWLSLQKLDTIRPDPGRFPEFDDSLRQAMTRETEMLFEHVMHEDLSVMELLTADYTFVNERLARHYGIRNILGSQFRRVAVPDERRGLLGHGGILALTSYPTRTSPVVRGKWILETLVGSPPPPPPANVPALNEADRDKSGKVLSMREKMAEHRKNPVCASCHLRMDPPGFALEPFNAIGAKRNDVVDASGVLPDGTKFDGPTGLREAMVRRPEVFVTAMTEKLFIYALGRGLEYYDAPALRAVARDAAAANYKFSSLVLGVVRSVPFRMRRAADEEPGGKRQ